MAAAAHHLSEAYLAAYRRNISVSAAAASAA